MCLKWKLSPRNWKNSKNFVWRFNKIVDRTQKKWMKHRTSKRNFIQRHSKNEWSRWKNCFEDTKNCHRNTKKCVSTTKKSISRHKNLCFESEKSGQKMKNFTKKSISRRKFLCCESEKVGHETQKKKRVSRRKKCIFRPKKRVFEPKKVIKNHQKFISRHKKMCFWRKKSSSNTKKWCSTQILLCLHTKNVSLDEKCVFGWIFWSLSTPNRKMVPKPLQKVIFWPFGGGYPQKWGPNPKNGVRTPKMGSLTPKKGGSRRGHFGGFLDPFFQK